MEIEYGHVMIAGGVIGTPILLVMAWINWRYNRKRSIGLPPAVEPPKAATENPNAGRQQSEPLVGRVSDEVWRDNVQDHMG